VKEIIAVDQEFMHDPDNGVYGDCMRACIATLLSLPIQDVPHFLHDCDYDKFDERVNEFLASRGLCLVDTLADATDFYHLIYGYTVRGTYHAVVGKNGNIVHDPHPSKAGLVDGEWESRFFERVL
jgi:hypothetical protein